MSSQRLATRREVTNQFPPMESEILVALRLAFGSRYRGFDDLDTDSIAVHITDEICDALAAACFISELAAGRIPGHGEADSNNVQLRNFELLTLRMALPGLMDRGIRRDSPLRPWYDFATVAADWLLSRDVPVAVTRSGEASSPPERPHSLWKDSEFRNLFRRLYSELRSSGDDAVQVLTKLAGQLPFISELSSLLSEIGVTLEVEDRHETVVSIESTHTQPVLQAAAARRTKARARKTRATSDQQPAMTSGAATVGNRKSRDNDRNGKPAKPPKAPAKGTKKRKSK